MVPIGGAAIGARNCHKLSREKARPLPPVVIRRVICGAIDAYCNNQIINCARTPVASLALGDALSPSQLSSA